VAASFGAASSSTAESLQAMGLRKSSNAELKTRWQNEAGAVLAKLGLTAI